ncbi:MAG: LysR family transcriptional regulator, partial [Granulosicoccaceae bacterium]
MRLPSLTALKSFNAAAEHLSFKKAADQLSVTPAALSFQIRQLEEELGCELFVRENRQVRLSNAGATIQADIRQGFECFEQAFRRLQRSRRPEILNISCGPTFAANWLAPLLHEFLLLQPQLETRISSGLALVDLHSDDVDIALRFSSPNQPGCRVIKLVDDYLTPMCSPAYLAKAPSLLEPSDLSNHVLIHSVSCDHALKMRCWSHWLDR